MWFDEFELRLGMSLRRSIDKGLAGSRYGAVILSRAFFGKDWPERELDGLSARETTDRHHLILPVWHGVEKHDVAAYSPVLADRVAVRSKDGLGAVVTSIVDAIGPPHHAASDTSTGSQDVRLSPLPAAVELMPVLIGAQVVRLMDGTFEAAFELDRLPRGPGRHRTAKLFDDLRDRADNLSELKLADRDRLEDELSDEIKELLDAGVVLFGGSYIRQLQSPGRSEPWPGFVIRAVPLEEAQERSPAPSGGMSSDDATVIALAQVLIDKGDTKGAQKHLLPLTERGNGYAMLLLGMLLRDDGKNDEAADMLRRAVDAGRNEALTPLGMILRDLGRLAEAEAVLAQAAEQQQARPIG